MMSNATQHILVLEDHDIVASALAAIINELLPEAKVLLANTFQKGVRLLKEVSNAELIILDINLPGGGNTGMVGALRSIQPGVRILVFTGDDDYKQAIQFLSAGANGFLSKNAPSEEIIIAIKKVLANKKFITEAIQQKVTDSFLNDITSPPSYAEAILSPREQEVMKLLLDGKPTKEIANTLNLKLTTVSTHKGRIFEKMEVGNIIELFRKVNEQQTENRIL